MFIPRENLIFMSYKYNFQSFLKLDFEIKPHVADGFQLRLDAIYFTASANFFVVGASSTVAEANVHLENIFLNNESMPISQSNLEDLVLFCIDTEVFLISVFLVITSVSSKRK